MATLKIDAADLVPALVLAPQDPTVRALLVAPPTPPATPRYLAPKAYAERLDVSERTIRKWAARGLPVVRMGGVVRVRVAEADAWLESGGNVRAAVLRTLRDVAVRR